MPEICIIVAMDEHRVIGASSGKIPWHLPADFKHFKELTMGHPIVMGRKTFESIGKPLSGRTNVVITRDPDYVREGIIVAHSLDEAVELAKQAAGTADKIFIIGGAEIYAMALDRANTLFVTKVHGNFDGDIFFPEFHENDWRLVSSEDRPKDEKNPFDMTFLTYERKI